MKPIGKHITVNAGIVAAAIALILLLLPHDDRQSYNYELNQPWRYQLLTVGFDMPILRDSSSARLMRDSIDHAFVPFVKRDASVAKNNITKFRNAISGKVAPARANYLTDILERVYGMGIVDTDVYNQIHKGASGHLRVADIENGANAVETIDARDMLSPQGIPVYRLRVSCRTVGTGRIRGHRQRCGTYDRLGAHGQYSD